MKTIFGDPIHYPDQPVRAWVGALASDFLGDYATPRKAVQAAYDGGYGIVHVIYDDGKADAIATANQHLGWTVADEGVIDQEASDRYDLNLNLNLNDNLYRRVGS
jgi:hypothetical protein